MLISDTNKIVISLMEWKKTEKIQLPAEITEEAESCRLLMWITVIKCFKCRTHQKIEENEFHVALIGFDSCDMASSEIRELLLNLFREMPSLSSIKKLADDLAADLDSFFVSVIVNQQDHSSIPVIRILLISGGPNLSWTCDAKKIVKGVTGPPSPTVNTAIDCNADHLGESVAAGADNSAIVTVVSPAARFVDWLMNEINVSSNELPRGFQKVTAPIVITKRNLNEDEDEGEECEICNHSFCKVKKVIILQCSHKYHHKCLLKWFKRQSITICSECKSTCPKCRIFARVQVPSLADD